MIIMGWRYCVGCLHVYGFVNSLGVVDRGLFVSDGGIMSNVVRCVGDIYTGYGDVYIREGEGYGFDNYGAVKLRGLTIPYEVRENYFWGVLVNVLARLENEDSYKSMLEVVDCYMVEFFRSGQVVYFSDVSKEKGRGAYLDFKDYICGDRKFGYWEVVELYRAIRQFFFVIMYSDMGEEFFELRRRFRDGRMKDFGDLAVGLFNRMVKGDIRLYPIDFI